MKVSLEHLLLLAVAALGSACAKPAFARLDGVLVDANPAPRPATAAEPPSVEVKSSGTAVVAGRERQPIRKGDSLATSDSGIAVIRLDAGYEVIIEPGTQLAIENPSILLHFGRVIIKKLKKVKEKLTVKTTIASASAEGTEFLVEVNAKRETIVSVLEGTVKVAPRGDAKWKDTTLLRGGERITLTAGSLIQMPRYDNSAIQRLEERIARIEGVARPVTPFWQKPIFLVPAAVGVGLTTYILVRGNNREGTVAVTIPF